MTVQTQFRALIALGAIFTAGCDGDVSGPPEPARSNVGSIVLELRPDTLSVNETTQLQATVLSVDGDALPNETVRFGSSSNDIATVSGAGLVTAIGPGVATITARAGNETAMVTVYVRDADGNVPGSPWDY